MENLTKFEVRAIKFIDTFMKYLDTYSYDRKIEKYKIEIEDNDSTYRGVNWAISNRKTVSKTIIITVKLVGEKSSTQYLVSIPTPSNNLFVYEGKVRINLNYLDNNKVVRVTENVLLLDRWTFVKVRSKDKSENFTIYERQYDPETKEKSVVKLDSLSLEDKDPMIAQKLKILFELDELPTVLTQDFLRENIADKYHLELRDHICNKTIETTASMLLRHLEDSMGILLRSSRPIFYKSGEINVKGISTLIQQFFNLRSITSVGVQVPNNINPITYSNLRDKIILSKGQDLGISFSRMDATYTDFIDMIVTPDNKNVGRSNELTQVLNITEDGTYVKCYDASFNLTEIPFMDYLSSNILPSSCVDYDREKILNTDLIKQGGTVRENTRNLKFDYIECEPDMRLSKSVQMIPMINHSDSVRSSMGARMIGQSIEVIGCENPEVATGYEAVDSDLSVKAEVSGKVVGVTNGTIVVQTEDIDSNGDYRLSHVARPNNLESMYGINISFNPRVKIGDSISKGEIIYSPNSIDTKGYFNAGVNCNVAMLNYRGYTYEDGLVISETAARRFAHLSVVDLELVVMPNFRVNGIRVPSDEKLTSLDSIVDYDVKLDRISAKVNKARRDLLGEDYYYKSSKLKLPLNVKEAYLLDAKYIVGELPSEEDETEYRVEGTLGGSPKAIEPPIPYDYRRLALSDFRDEISCSYRIKFRFLVVNHLEPGDKITNRYGSKGVVGLVEKDEYMPRMLDGTPIEVIMNPSAVVSRKNISQTMEVYLTGFGAFLKEECKKILSTSGDLDRVRELLIKYKFKKYYKMEDEELIQSIEGTRPFQVITGCYSKITIKEIIDWYVENDLAIGKKLRDGKTGRMIRKPVIVGNMYLIKLYHLAGKKAQVTVDRSIKQNLVLGSGKISGAGMKHGNMEVDGIIANNLTSYLNFVEGNDKLKSGWFLAHMINAGLTLNIDDEDEK